jgi:hypothetical protein
MFEYRLVWDVLLGVGSSLKNGLAFDRQNFTPITSLTDGPAGVIGRCNGWGRYRTEDATSSGCSDLGQVRPGLLEGSSLRIEFHQPTGSTATLLVDCRYETVVDRREKWLVADEQSPHFGSELGTDAPGERITVDVVVMRERHQGLAIIVAYRLSGRRRTSCLCVEFPLGLTGNDRRRIDI